MVINMKKKLRKNKNFDSPLPVRLASSPAAAALTHAYTAVVNARNFAYDSLPVLSKKANRPVISVGGIRAGGTGKTPAALLTAQHILNNRGYDVAFLSRGYGRSTDKTIIVKPHEKAKWEETGDEPCMLHDNLPESWLGIGVNRAAAAKKLSRLIPEKSVFILDDGFQHRQLRRDLNIVCLSESTFDDRMIPSGYLREPVSSLARADIALVIGSPERIDKLKEVEAVAANQKSPPVTAILLQRPVSWVEARTGKVTQTPPLPRPAVICGIARPDRFLAMLRSLSVEPSEVRCFRDHYKFKKNDFALAHDIYSDGVVTTEKDAVRLLSTEFAYLREIWYLKIGLRFADSESEVRVLSKINCVLS
jgi:tetraacyldisaccharide 4'-kinase